MEPETTNRRPRLVRRMEDHDAVSQASSVVTIASFPVRTDTGDRVQTFGKRFRAARRDPNCAVVIRGWLNKKDSSGLKLWKRRWFVLSNYCLFYYKDSREESVLGSIPLPSYNILFCTPRECKNRKNTFKVVHQGMRSYFFSADTQEDMLGWVRALSQSACMESDGPINGRCSSYQDFTQIGASSEFVELTHSPSHRDGLSHNALHIRRSHTEPSQLTGGRMGMPHTEQKGRRSGRQSPLPKTPSPPEFSRRRGYVSNPNHDEDALPFLSVPNTPPKPGEFTGTGSLTPRGQLGSRPHTPVGRVDIRPQDDLSMPQTLCYAPASPRLEYKSSPQTPVTERWNNISQPIPTYTSIQHVPTGRRALTKPPKADVYKEREPPPIRSLENDADAVLTRLCGCDKLLQSLSLELAQLQVDKDSVQCALEMTRVQLEDWRSQGLRGQEGALTQKALLQEELVTIRARMCDVSLEMERVWCQYERMESELSVFRSHLQHVCNFGMPQEQSQAQRELWMMEDILAGLKVNREHFRVLLGLQRHQVPHPAFQKTPPQPSSPGSPTERLYGGPLMGVEPEPPARPPLPQELQDTNQGREHMWANSNYEHIYCGRVDSLHGREHSQPYLPDDKNPKETSESQSSSRWTTPDTTIKKGRMSEEEQLDRMKRNQERLANRKKPPQLSPTTQTQSPSSEAGEECPFPLRVTRVLTAVLPSTLIARRVSVEDPPPELINPLPEQIPPEMQKRLSDQSRKLLSKTPRRLLPEMPDQNSSWTQAEMVQEQSAQRLAKVLQDLASERNEQNSYGPSSSRAQQHLRNIRSFREEPLPEASNSELEETALRPPRSRERAALGNGGVPADSRVRGEDEEHVSSRGIATDEREGKAEGRPSVLLTSDLDPDPCLTPEQREAKLRRVERIRERVIKSAVRESAAVPCHVLLRRERRDLPTIPPTQTTDTPTRRREMSDSGLREDCGGCWDSDRSVLHTCATVEPPALRRTSPHEGDQGGATTAGQNGHFGNKTPDEEASSKKSIMKRKKKACSSSHEISSMTVHQRDVGLRFNRMCEKEPEEDREYVSAIREEAGSLSTNLRAEWFLSTNQWQGFIPLQNHGIETLCDDVTSHTRVDPPPPCCAIGTNSNEDSSSPVFEKTLDNHSLFYRIACDINISDNDIAVLDGHSSVQASTNQEEASVGLTNEVLTADEVICGLVKATDPHSESSGCHTNATKCNGNLMTTNNQPEAASVDQDTPPALSPNTITSKSIKPVHELCIYEEIPGSHAVSKPISEDPSDENQLKAEEEGCSTNPVAPDPSVSEHTDEHQMGETMSGKRGDDESMKTNIDQEVAVDLKGVSGGLEGEKEETQVQGSNNNPTVPECITSLVHEDGRAHQSTPFGSARVTVLRTSL